jgi:hypothetical protein
MTLTSITDVLIVGYKAAARAEERPVDSEPAGQ